MIVVKETEKYKLYWHDIEKTILIVDLLADITWEEAIVENNFINEVLGVEAENHPVYSIGDLSKTSIFIPKGDNAVKNLYDLIKADPGYEELVIFVVPINLLSPLIKIGINFYGILPIIHKYHFVKTRDEALSVVERHKQDRANK